MSMLVSRLEYVRLRAKNVQDHVSIFDVLEYYAIPVRTHARESQFPCPLHGDGSDSSFSARAYPDSNATYCWACSKKRDTIAFVREQENLSFFAAIKTLEQRYAVPPLPSYFQIIDDELKQDEETGEVRLVNSLEAMLNPKPEAQVSSDGWDKGRAESMLKREMTRYHTSPERSLKIWSIFDILAFEVSTGIISTELAAPKMHLLLGKVGLNAKV